MPAGTPHFVENLYAPPPAGGGAWDGEGEGSRNVPTVAVSCNYVDATNLAGARKELAMQVGH